MKLNGHFWKKCGYEKDKMDLSSVQREVSGQCRVGREKGTVPELHSRS
jgi:hypothetical protein